MDNNYRHEYKYLFSRADAELLRRRLPHVMKPDPHAGASGQYTIRSLYFDDPAFDAFYEKVSGVDNRTKYRIRCYNYSNQVFRLEKKEKKGELTRKTGQFITPRDVRFLQRPTAGHCPDTPEGLAEELRPLIAVEPSPAARALMAAHWPGPLTLDLDAYRAERDGRDLELTNREFECLRELIQNQGRVMTYQMLVQRIWNYDYLGDERVIYSHIKNLRRKLWA